MKTLIQLGFILGLVLLTAPAKAAATDTIYTLRNEKIACKVHEIGQVEIKYKKIENLDGPFYTILRERVRSIRYANGFEEMMVPDEMDVHKEEPIFGKKSVVKFEIFSPMLDQISFGYERVIKPGINVEAKAGFINNSMFPFSFSNGGDFNNNLIQGGFAKAGIKVLLGSHTYVPGAKYRHPLYGSYFQFNIGQTMFAERGIRFYQYGPYPYPYPSPYVYTDRKVRSTSLTIMYGHQFILANTITLGLAVGVGYSYTYWKYTNPVVNEMIKANPGYDNYYDGMFYSHVTVGHDARSPLCVTGNFTVGYILK